MVTIPTDTNIDALYAKIRARRARMYEKEKLSRLCQLRSLPGLAAELYPEQGIESPRQFQKRLVDDHLASLVWILDFLGEPQYGFFLWLLRRYQIENIKVIFRGFHSRRPPADVLPYLAAVPEQLAVPAERLLAAPTAHDFAGELEKDPLHDMVAEAAAAYREHGKPFYFDASIDRVFYATLTSLAEHQELWENDRGSELVSLDAAIYLIMLTIRLKTSYRVEFESFAPYLRIPHTIGIDKLREIYSSPGTAAAVESLPKGLRKQMPARVDTSDELERALAAYFHRRADSVFYHSGVALAAVVAFHYLKRTELANLIRLVESYRYGLSATEMRQSLLPPLEQP
ncbi:MAG TPA: V-type ATPase subunit [Planctomycetota bacterium]|nr:V-type ATPase subunit [Planctomycetota bacterium]